MGALELVPCNDITPELPPELPPPNPVQVRFGFDLGPLFDRQVHGRLRGYVKRGEALDVRAIGEATCDDGVYRLRSFTEGIDYCDLTTDRWIWSIGRHKSTGEILASIDTRFYGNDEWECIWLR